MVIVDAPAANETATLKEVEAALNASDMERAMSLARDALQSEIEHPLFLNLRAFWFERQGQNKQAHADLVRAQVLAPDSIPVLNALGLSYARIGQPRDAVTCFDRIIALDPSFGPAHFNKAWSSEEFGDLETAWDSYRRARELMPQSGGPPSHMAALSTRAGRWEDAETYANQALALEPGAPKALMALAGLDTTRGNPQAAEQRLNNLIGRSEVSQYDRALALSQLGDVLDRQDKPAEAFAAYTRANDVTRELYAERFSAPGVVTIPDFLRWMTALFEEFTNADWPVSPPAISDPATAPSAHAFLLGFPRSGTTLLEQVLASHPGAVTSAERDALEDGVREYLGSPEAVRQLAGLRGAALKRHRNAYWQRVRSYGYEVAGRVYIDKQPVNTLNLPLIAKLFPGAKILFAIRDPRDVVLSCFRRSFQINPSNFEFLTLERTARYYDATMRLAALYRERLPIDVMELRHEDMVDDFDNEVRKVCDFIGLGWDDTMRNFAASARTRSIATPSSLQVIRGLNRDGMDQWRRYEQELAPILPILRPWIERHGYAPD